MSKNHLPTYLFFHSAGYYPLGLKDDQEAKHRAETHPTIIRVETLDSRVVWADNNRLNPSR